MPRQLQSNVEITIIQGDIVTTEARAIVVPTTTTGALTSNLGRTIKEMGGEKIEEETMDAAPIAVGAAVVTAGGPTGANALIHVPLTITPADRIGIEGIRRATRAALLASNIKNFRSVVMPPMCSTAETGIPPLEIARAMVDEFRAHKNSLPEEVIVVVPGPTMADAFDKILSNSK
ncbi:MAG: macro domain-containing protein [Deltaproteobacteria bacterium]|nr:macro domain-containing protein [Deltaproteobacteria bacterium]